MKILRQHKGMYIMQNSLLQAVKDVHIWTRCFWNVKKIEKIKKPGVLKTLGFCLVDHQGLEPWTP